MNKILAIAIFSMLFALSNAQSIGAGNGALSIANLIVTPNPAHAGSKVQISFQLYNSYQYSLQNVNLYLEGAYPLLNYSPQTIGEINNIGEGLYGGANNYLTYNLTIPNTTPSGVYTLDLYATYQTTQETQTGAYSYTQPTTAYSSIPITIHVVNRPEISISSNVNSAIAPGEPFTMLLNLQNNGYDNARNITISIPQSGLFKPVGTDKYTIGLLPMGSSVQLPVEMMAGEGIDNETYTIPISISYYSSTGTEYNESADIGISSAVEMPNISISLIGSEPQTLLSGYNQSLEFAVVNSGNGPARNISIDVYAGKSINLLGSIHRFFISLLPSGGSIDESLLISSNFTNDTLGYLIFNASYLSSNYKESFSKSFNESIYIEPSAQFEVVNVKSGAYPGATDIPITYTIKNNGNEAAEQVQISFQSVYPITPINGNAYIAKLLPGEEANVTFMVNIDTSGLPGNYPVTIFETWKQPNGTPNQEYSGSNNYYAPIYQGPKNSDSAAWIITIIIVAAVIIYFSIKRRIKKSEKR